MSLNSSQNVPDVLVSSFSQLNADKMRKLAVLSDLHDNKTSRAGFIVFSAESEQMPASQSIPFLLDSALQGEAGPLKNKNTPI